MNIRNATAVLTMMLPVAALAAPFTVPMATQSGTLPDVQLVHEGHGGAARTSGTINSVDVEHRMVNLSHKAVPAFGWPAMTMDFPVADDVDLTQVKPGMRVDATLVREDGKVTVDTLHPSTSR